MFFLTKATLFGVTKMLSDRILLISYVELLSISSTIFSKSIERRGLTPNFLSLPSLKISFKDPIQVE